MTSSYSSKVAKNYVCVDHAPEVDKGGAKDEPSADLYPVAAHCGALPCPGYVNRKTITCVVCSQ